MYCKFTLNIFISKQEGLIKNNSRTTYYINAQITARVVQAMGSYYLRYPWEIFCNITYITQYYTFLFWAGVECPQTRFC